MEDSQKTRAQLLEELTDLRRRVGEASASTGGKRHTEREGIHRDASLGSIYDGYYEIDLERYRDFVESIEDGCFEVDLDGTLTFINAGMCRIHGCTYDELIGMNHRDFAPAEEAKMIFNVFNSIYRTGNPAKIVDYNILQKDGAIRNLEVSASLICDTAGHPVGFRGITRDRTNRREREKALERYQAFVEGVGDACFEVDLRGDITFCNQAACRIFGYSAEQLMGMNNRSYASEEMSKKVYHIFNEVYRTGDPGEVQDYEIRRGDGVLRHLHMTIDLIHNDGGAPVGFRGFLRDVTDQKATEAENERLISMLNQSQRLEAIATLAAGVAHNFNNLLMSIQGFVSLMFLDIEEGHQHFSRLKTIEDLIKRGSELTTQLLGYARHGRFAVRSVDVGKTMQLAINHFKVKYPDIPVHINLPDKLWVMAADSEQIEAAFKHLLTNAGDAMPDGGTLDVAAENILLKEHFVAPHGLMSGPYVKIAVTDTGVGMDPATRERIFEPFFSTKDVSKGAGLGLASVYGTIQNHNGIIQVESEKGRGSKFTLYLPALSKEAQKDVQSEPPVCGVSPTILVVDDERVICEVVSDLIDKMGYQAIIACDGNEALDIFRDRQEQIDLVIVDMVMPGLSGEEVVDAMRAIVPGIKAILISGFPEAEEVQSAMRDTRQTFLQKPLQSKTLSATIRQLLEV